MEVLKECCVCGEQFTGWPNNPEPFKGKSACEECNDRFVTPVRMCLGRDFSDENILLLLTTIAELGNIFRRNTVRAYQALREKNENGTAHSGKPQ
jgi:hypothetical protein